MNNMNENTKVTKNISQVMNDTDVFKTIPTLSDKFIEEMERKNYYMGTKTYAGRIIRIRIDTLNTDDERYLLQTLALSIKQIPLGTTIGNPYTVDFSGVGHIDFCINVDNIIDKRRIKDLTDYVLNCIKRVINNRENTISISVFGEKRLNDDNYLLMYNYFVGDDKYSFSVNKSVTYLEIDPVYDRGVWTKVDIQCHNFMCKDEIIDKTKGIIPKIIDVLENDKDVAIYSKYFGDGDFIEINVTKINDDEKSKIKKFVSLRHNSYNIKHTNRCIFGYYHRTFDNGVSIILKNDKSDYRPIYDNTAVMTVASNIMNDIMKILERRKIDDYEKKLPTYYGGRLIDIHFRNMTFASKSFDYINYISKFLHDTFKGCQDYIDSNVLLTNCSINLAVLTLCFDDIVDKESDKNRLNEFFINR